MYKANKNIDHNGKFYAKDQVVNESDPGFKDLVKAGHVAKDDGEAPAPKAEKPMPAKAFVEESVDEDAIEEKKSKGKSRR